MIFFTLGYVSFLCEEHPEILEDGICESDAFVESLMERLEMQPTEITLTPAQTAEVVSGKCGLSQRSYLALKSVLAKEKVKLPSWSKLTEYLQGLDVGQIFPIQCGDDGCMGYATSLQETVQMAVNSAKHDLDYPSQDQQEKLFEFLKMQDKELYQTLDASKRTIFLRQTGDNFRASLKMPTEQISFSILNCTKMIGSPYGQFINCLYRGNESRAVVEVHCKAYFSELDKVAREGLPILVDGVQEHFNVVVFLVADLGLLEKVLGKCSSTSIYGCFWCDKHQKNWDCLKADKGNGQSIAAMTKTGEEAEQVLGKEPDHYCSKFKNFQQSHLGQYVSIISLFCQ